MLFKLKESDIKCKLQQTKSCLNFYMSNPQELNGKRVFHKCEENGLIDWFPAEIKDISEKTADPMKTKFTIVHDICKTEEYIFPLLIDIKKSDLYNVFSP